MKKSPKFTYIEKFYSILLISGTLLSSAILSNAVTQADNIFGERCGPDLVCTGEQTCQLQLNGQPVGTLPGQTETNIDPTTGAPNTTISYQCIDPPVLEAPNSPYRGPQVDGYNTVTPNPTDPGVPVNIINQGPVPVDIFNPLPVPTNIVSPNPIPVVVVDDLALYQQARIDDYVTEQTKKQTIADNQQIALTEAANSGSLVANPQEYIETAATLTAQNATLQQVAEEFDNAFVPAQTAIDLVNETTAQELTQGVSADPIISSGYQEQCEGVDPTQAGLICTVLGLQDNPQNQLLQVVDSFVENQDIARIEGVTRRDEGDGIFPVTDNPFDLFNGVIETPGTFIKDTLEELVLAPLEQVLNADGNCTEAQGLQVLEGTVNRVFSDGLVTVANSIDIQNIDPTDPASITGQFEQIGEQLQQVGQDILNNLIEGISCELSGFIQGTVGPWLDQLEADLNV